MAKKGSRTREARQRRQRQRRQNRWTIMLLAIVIVAVVAIAMVVVSNQPVEAHILPDSTERYQGISRSFSVEGYPQLGDLNAPVTLDEYASFACPGCEALHSESFDAILDRVRSGQVLYTYVPMQTGSIPNAQGAARAALCAGRQGMFWEMHDVLFDWQTRYANTAYSQNRLLAGAEALGLNTTTLTNCFNSGAISETLNRAMAEDVSGTPTIQVNGVTIAAGRAGGVPSTIEILKAIDDATPNDWGQPEEPPADVAPATAGASQREDGAETQPQTQVAAGEVDSTASADADQPDVETTAEVAEDDVEVDDVSVATNAIATEEAIDETPESAETTESGGS